MTDINQINKAAQSLAASNNKASNTKGTNAFETALSNALDQTQADAMDVMPTNTLREIAPIDLNIIKSSDIVLQKTDKLLEMMDAYSLKLKDPDVSLRNVAMDLEEINQGAGNLLNETRHLTEADTGLKNIATQTIVTAQTEYLKFQRGDYLS